DRKRRLLACACTRRVLSLLPPGVCERAVEVSESYADALSTDSDLRAARQTVAKFLKGPEAAPHLAYHHSAAGAVYAVLERKFMSFKMALESAAAARAAQAWPAWDEAHGRETRAQLTLTRDLFANPFRAKPTLDPSWL